MENNRIELVKSYEGAIIDTSREIKANPVLLEVATDFEYIPVMTLGNFSAVTGQAKSRKSFFACLLLGTIARGRMNGNLVPRIKRNLLLFDTEQGPYHTQRYAKRVEQIAGNSGLTLTTVALRPFNTRQRIELIKYGIYQEENIGLVVIDGIRDLVSDINNPDQATYVSNLLLKWTMEQDVHILNVIHQNKADNNARGHIGSEIINKSETVFSVRRDPLELNKSIVKCEYTRGREFEEFFFEIENNIPTLPEYKPINGKLMQYK